MQKSDIPNNMELWSRCLIEKRPHYLKVFELTNIKEYQFVPTEEKDYEDIYILATDEQFNKAFQTSQALYTKMKQAFLRHGWEVENVPEDELYYGIQKQKILELSKKYQEYELQN